MSELAPPKANSKIKTAIVRPIPAEIIPHINSLIEQRLGLFLGGVMAVYNRSQHIEKNDLR